MPGAIAVRGAGVAGDDSRAARYGARCMMECKVSAPKRVALDEGDLKTIGQWKGPGMDVLFTSRIKRTRCSIPDDR